MMDAVATEHYSSTWGFCHELLSRAAQLLDQSLKVVWPGNGPSNGDLSESNVSVQLAHVLIEAGFRVFAEVPYLPSVPPKRGIERLDLLAIAPDLSWFVAIELKSTCDGHEAEAIKSDAVKVRRFAIHPDMPSQWCGDGVLQALMRAEGFGLIGALVAVKKKNARTWLEYWTGVPTGSTTVSGSRLNGELGAHSACAIPVEGCGRTEYIFYLLGGLVQLRPTLS